MIKLYENMIRGWCHLRRIEDKVVVKWEIVKLGVIGQVQVVLKSFFKAFCMHLS